MSRYYYHVSLIHVHHIRKGLIGDASQAGNSIITAAECWAPTAGHTHRARTKQHLMPCGDQSDQNPLTLKRSTETCNVWKCPACLSARSHALAASQAVFCQPFCTYECWFARMVQQRCNAGVNMTISFPKSGTLPVWLALVAIDFISTWDVWVSYWIWCMVGFMSITGFQVEAQPPLLCAID